MAVARLCSTLYLFIFLKVCHGQLSLINQPGLSLSLSNTPEHIQQALQRKNALIANPKSFNDVTKSAISIPNGSQQNNKGNFQGSPQSITFQQQSNVLTGNSQGLQYSQQQQQPLNVNSQSLSQQILTQSQQQALQQQIAQQQNSFSGVNLQFAQLQALPANNGPMMGLPAQQSIQGSQAVTSGTGSNNPSLSQNNRQPSITQLNNVESLSNMPITLNVGPSTSSSQTGVVSSVSNDLSNSLSPIQSNPQSSDTTNSQSQGQFTLKSIHLQPLTSIQQLNKENQLLGGPNQQVSQNQQYQQMNYQNQQAYNQPQNNPNRSVQQASNQNQPFASQFYQSPNNQNQLGGQFIGSNQQHPNAPNQPYPSFHVSPNPANNNNGQYSNAPGNFPNPGMMQNINQGLSMKNLLPLILNMLNDKGSCCSCRKCNCPNNPSTVPNCQCNQQNIKRFENPQVVGGYSNSINYSPCNQISTAKVSQNEDHANDSQEEEEEENSVEVFRNNKKYRKRKMEEEEYSDEDDEYSCEENDV